MLSGFDPSIRVRKELEAFFGVGLSSANPFSAVSELIDVSGAQAKIGGCVLPASSEILLISTGKASEPMAKAVEKKLGSQIVGGIVVMRNRDDTIVFDNLETIESSHPVPDARSEKAAKTVMNALDGFQVNADHPDRRVVYCVSGGTSSLMACPMHGLSMADIQETTQSLLGAGATIHEINTVRKHITDFSGGKLAGHFNGEIDVLVLSDVMGDDLDVIASGPCVADRSTYQDAVAVIAKFELEADIPKPVMDVLDRGCSGNIEETAKPGAVRFSAVETYLVGSNRRSLDAIVEDAQSKGLA
ncbi:MAG: glycerate 2-kinase, partial [Candidatus Marinamargulisbacteria bacterium]